jgi:hypothetical protein
MDNFKLGSDITEFISNKSNLYKIVNVLDKDNKNKVHRCLLSDKGILDDLNIYLFITR